MRTGASVVLLNAATTTTSGDAHQLIGNARTYSASGTTSAGSGSATIVIEVRNDTSEAYITMGTITLTLGTTATADGLSSIVPWKYTRARVTAISGTNATVSVYAGTLSP